MKLLPAASQLFVAKPAVTKCSRQAPAAAPLVRWLASLAVAATLLGRCRAQDEYDSVCKHERYPTVMPPQRILDGVPHNRTDIRSNQTHTYWYENRDIATLNHAHIYRKLIISLEACRGIVYLFVRKTRRCYPDPYSCIDLTPGIPWKDARKSPDQCKWTHFMSVIDGSRDGTPTFFEIPFTTTKYLFSVFSADNSQYSLTVVSDIGAYPRPGKMGRVYGDQHGEMKVSLGWHEADYIPSSATGTAMYIVYAAPLLDTDKRISSTCFLRPQKIMNTYCGLERNTDEEVFKIDPEALCRDGYCNVTIDWVMPERRYVFNVVAVSRRNFNFKAAYAGLIMRTQYDVIKQAASDNTLKGIGVLAGGSMGMVIVIYFMMLKLYG